MGGARRLFINRGVRHLIRLRFTVRPEAIVFRLTSAPLPGPPAPYTSHSFTASPSDVSGSRLGTNSSARKPVYPASAIARHTAR